MQDDTCVHAKLKRHANDGSESEEDIQVAYLIGADGAKGIFVPKRKTDDANLCSIGVTRKLLGLTFHGSTRDEHLILCDMQLDIKNLDRNVCVYLHAKEPWKPINLPVLDSTGTSLVKCLLACRLSHPCFPSSTHLPFSRVFLRPTDELGSNGYQVLVTNAARDLTHLVHDKELLVAYIKETIGLGDDVKVVEILWLSDFRYVQRFLLL